jgi:hypothetical protein
VKITTLCPGPAVRDSEKENEYCLKAPFYGQFEESENKIVEYIVYIY